MAVDLIVTDESVEDKLVLKRLLAEIISRLENFAQPLEPTTAVIQTINNTFEDIFFELFTATPVINLSKGTVFAHTVTTNTTYKITSSAKVPSFTLIITNGGSATVTWPTNMKWPAATAPILTPAGIDVLTFISPDAGINWYGFIGGLDMRTV